MGNLKLIAGIISILLMISATIIYFRMIVREKAKPPAFSWLVWGLLLSVIFAAQMIKNGGAGAWATGATAVTSFLFFYILWKKGQRKFSSAHGISLVVVIVSLIFWSVTKNPLGAVLLLIGVDAVGFFFTAKKGYQHPEEDSVLFWSFSATKWLFAILAMGSYSAVTLLYPAYLFLTSGGYTLLLIWKKSREK